jgi:hypothetical protein
MRRPWRSFINPKPTKRRPHPTWPVDSVLVLEQICLNSYPLMVKALTSDTLPLLSSFQLVPLRERFPTGTCSILNGCAWLLGIFTVSWQRECGRYVRAFCGLNDSTKIK